MENSSATVNKIICMFQGTLVDKNTLNIITDRYSRPYDDRAKKASRAIQKGRLSITED